MFVITFDSESRPDLGIFARRASALSHGKDAEWWEYCSACQGRDPFSEEPEPQQKEVGVKVATVEEVARAVKWFLLEKLSCSNPEVIWGGKRGVGVKKLLNFLPVSLREEVEAEVKREEERRKPRPPEPHYSWEQLYAAVKDIAAGGSGLPDLRVDPEGLAKADALLVKYGGEPMSVAVK